MKNLLQQLFLGCCLLLLAAPAAIGQSPTQEDCVRMLTKALPGAGEGGDFAITFEGIAFGLERPQAIFTAPVYEVHRGGYLFVKGSKYEIDLGMMKALCDGKLMVVIDEAGKTMYVDSLRTSLPNDQRGTSPDVAQLLGQTFGDAKVTYQGKEMVNGQSCHKLRTQTEGGEYISHSLFWISEATGNLVLMADWAEGGYDTYWVRSVGATPKGHDFSVNLPKQELDELYGYKVTDLRYASLQLQSHN
jgi:hypothetical protein